MKSIEWISLSFCLCLLTLVLGCGPSGPKLYPVQGVVKVNGKPASAALVFMHEKARDAMRDPLPYGTCKEDGTFEIETPNVGKGAQVGNYTITVYFPDMSKPEDGNGQRPDALNGAYDRVDQSKITFEVKAGKNELPPLDLKPGPPRARPASDQNIK